MNIAVVIPARNEARTLGATLDRLLAAPPCPIEVVVVDGGSVDATAAIARSRGIAVIASAPGRARQMNLGARATRGEVLLFLHADTRLGREHLAAIGLSLGDPRVAGGSFPIRIDRPGAFFRLAEGSANLRTRIDGLPYGDQAIYCRRSAFDAVGGYPEQPILEDLAFARALGRVGRLRAARGPRVETSGRRWQLEGRLRTLLRNLLARLCFEAGVGPTRVRRLYDRWGRAGRL